MQEEEKTNYCNSLFNRSRNKTREVFVGELSIGGAAPISVQSMTTSDTMDTESSVDESIRMIDEGCELVRLTAPSKKEAENLAEIKKSLLERGYKTPLVADIHFTPNAAEIAVKHVEKVRVNPGNYADKKRFEEHTYTEESYSKELIRIEEKFTPLVLLCKKHKKSMRIGTNHGSLSDRILSRYGDTPRGMVESAIEFLNICSKNNFHNVVVSMKASNTLVMVQAYRLLVSVMKSKGMDYPLHLGVTEAGDGEDGRIKSAVGVGALLEDGLGDTIRVSLTEDPEKEIIVAKKLLKKFDSPPPPFKLSEKKGGYPYNPFEYKRRVSHPVLNVGGESPPVVFSDLSDIKNIKPSHFFSFGLNYSMPLDKWNLTDLAADFVYVGSQTLGFEVPGTLKVLCDFKNWKENYHNKKGFFPLINKNKIPLFKKSDVFFVSHQAEDENVKYLKDNPNAIIILNSKYSNLTQLYRNIYFLFAKENIQNPVVLCSNQKTKDPESLQLWASSELGSVLIDGFGDGVWIKGYQNKKIINSTSFGILQATRSRISKTEYISCPSCGRTLFDLQETTTKIRKKTSHLKGIKIGIMGCIVNGPGEMADADYGYVGTRPGKIHLYKKQTVVLKNVPEEDAVNELINLIKKHGDWSEQKKT